MLMMMVMAAAASFMMMLVLFSCMTADHRFQLAHRTAAALSILMFMFMFMMVMLVSAAAVFVVVMVFTSAAFVVLMSAATILVVVMVLTSTVFMMLVLTSAVFVMLVLFFCLSTDDRFQLTHCAAAALFFLLMGLCCLLIHHPIPSLKKILLVANMLHSLCQDGGYMVVIQRVKNGLSFAAVFDQTACTKQAQLVRNCRLGNAQKVA